MGLVIRGHSNKAEDNGFKLKEGRLRIDTKEKLFTWRVVRGCKSLPRERVDAPSHKVLKARLVGALGNLVWCEVSLL